MPATHKIVQTQVIAEPSGLYGVAFEFDDGWSEYAETGSEDAARAWANSLLGQEIMIGVHPLAASRRATSISPKS